MIAASSSGQSFGALGAYLVGDDGRVGWAETRNMMEGMDGGAIDPDAVAAEMRDEAAASGVAKPVYHIAIAFDPDDHPTEAEVRAAAVRTLRDLGLDEHQALVVRHTDQPHAHVHLMVNRVGPDGKAWSTWRDRYRLRSSMEAQERELGVRWTGRNRELERGAPALEAGAQSGNSERGFAAEVRAKALADLRESKSWSDLDGRLASHGLRVERRGREAVVTDGEREVRLSSVSRTVSRRRLENRLGPLRERANRTAVGEPSAPRRDRAAREYTGSPSARGRAPQTRGRGRPRKHQVSRTSNQIRSRRTHVLGKGAARGGGGTEGKRAPRLPHREGQPHRARGWGTAGHGRRAPAPQAPGTGRALRRADRIRSPWSWRTSSRCAWGERRQLHATAVPRCADAPHSGRPPRRPAGRAGGPAGRARRRAGTARPRRGRSRPSLIGSLSGRGRSVADGPAGVGAGGAGERDIRASARTGLRRSRGGQRAVRSARCAGGA